MPLFWPTLLGSVVVDFLLWRVPIWPPGVTTLLSPWIALLWVRHLRHQERDAQQLFWSLTMLLQRKCTRRHGAGPRDFRGLVLGAIAGGLTLTLAAPLLHIFIAPYEGASYAAATQLTSRVLGLRGYLLTDEAVANNPFLEAIPLPERKRQAFENIVVLTYDDPARRLAQSKSEAWIQAELLKKLTPTRPSAIGLALPPENPESQPVTSITTPRVGKDTIKRNTLDFPLLARQVQAAGMVTIAPPADGTQSEAGKAVLEVAQGTGDTRIETQGTIEAPALDTMGSPLPISFLMTRSTDSMPIRDPLFLIDYRLDLEQVRAPLSVSQVLQGAKLYDSPSRTWKSPEAFFVGKLVFIEALSPHLHETPFGPRGEMSIQATCCVGQSLPDSLLRSRLYWCSCSAPPWGSCV